MQTNWCVVTGGPSSGKTTLLKEFKKLGYRTVPEAAREIIDEELARGKTIREVRGDERSFQERVLERKLAVEQALSRRETVFLDRGVPDTVAYLQLHGMDWEAAAARCESGVYRRVFLLEQLPFERDYARTESKEEVARLVRLLQDAYEQLGYEVARVPVLTAKKRAQFVLERLAPMV